MGGTARGDWAASVTIAFVTSPTFFLVARASFFTIAAAAAVLFLVDAL
jgi:hypothetical protein